MPPISFRIASRIYQLTPTVAGAGVGALSPAEARLRLLQWETQSGAAALDGVRAALERAGVLVGDWNVMRPLAECLSPLLDTGEWVMTVSAELPISPIGGEAESDAGSPKESSRRGTSFYWVKLVDEHEQPIPRIPTILSVPGGNHHVDTDDSGMVRVDEVAAGFGAIRILAQPVREHLRGAEKSTRRMTALPDSPNFHSRSIRQLEESIAVPDGELQTVMVITRLDLHHDVNGAPYNELRLRDEQGPWRLEADKRLKLALHADHTSASVHLLESASASPPAVEPLVHVPSKAELFVPPNDYVVQPGDTLVLIAARLLGDGARWPEIWNLNKAKFPGRTADDIYPGDILTLPAGVVPEWVGAPYNHSAGDDEVEAEPAEWLWFGEQVDVLHDALLSKSWSRVWSALEAVPFVQTPLRSPALSAHNEEIAYRAALLELMLHGYVDLPGMQTLDEPSVNVSTGEEPFE